MEEDMNPRNIAASLLAGAVLLMPGCYQSGSNSGSGSGLGLLALMSLSGDAIAEMSQSSLDTVNDSMADINTSGSTTNVSFNVEVVPPRGSLSNLLIRLRA